MMIMAMKMMMVKKKMMMIENDKDVFTYIVFLTHCSSFRGEDRQVDERTGTSQAGSLIQLENMRHFSGSDRAEAESAQHLSMNIHIRRLEGITYGDG